MSQDKRLLAEFIQEIGEFTQQVSHYIKHTQDIMGRQKILLEDLEIRCEKATTTQKEYQELFETAEELQKQAEEKMIEQQKLLYTEMSKVDEIQLELQVAQKERDLALRKSGITPEQKQLLVKMEYESYKINETLERIDHISDMLSGILNDDLQDKQDA